MLTFAYITITPSQLHFIIKQISPPHHLNLTPHHLTTSPSQPHNLTTSQPHHLNLTTSPPQHISPLQHINLTTTTT
ncbi:MAG: hypothetical protein SPE27_09010 [Prevotella sp.]|nr:hypothetical protein [Prevotella sp.]